jgi:predicted PurR-regulated permease PerM
MAADGSNRAAGEHENVMREIMQVRDNAVRVSAEGETAPDHPVREQSRAQRRTGIAAALGLVVLAVWMLSVFLPALAWAAVLAIATWPLFLAARDQVGRTWAALAITLLIAIAVIGPLLFAGIQAAREIRDVAQWVIEGRQNGLEAPQWISEVPLIGPAFAGWLNSHLQGERGPFEGTDMRTFSEWGQIIGRQALRRITTLLFALLIVFFVFRDSETLLRQAKLISGRLLGPPGERFGNVAASAVRGTVDGLLLVGLGEALLLGIAYGIAGVPHPALFGALTGLMSAVPFASPVVFIAAGLWLLTQSQTAAAIALVAFGSAVVFVADHFVRPALIGGSTRLPFIWVLLGILGGVESFGLLGLFIGPALIAVLVSLWREIAAA